MKFGAYLTLTWVGIMTLITSSCNQHIEKPDLTTIPINQSNIIEDQTEQQNLAIGSTMLSPIDGMIMVYIPEGEFEMGSNNGDNDEKPISKIYLESYWIDSTEITIAMYAQCVKAGECKDPDHTGSFTRESYYGNPLYNNYPVILINWQAAVNYCNWAGKRLPTEAEWEKAARGIDGQIYPWGDNTSCEYANYFGKYNDQDYCIGDTTAVGSYPQNASPYGALDMAGNVWEWVSSKYANYPYTLENEQNLLDAKEMHVFRGGSWDDINKNIRSANRNEALPEGRFDNVGFRCAFSATKPGQ